MSATIDSGKLKFSVFGNGFENTRNDSGDGTNIRKESLNFWSTSAIIDNTKQYFWVAQAGGYLKKYDLTTLDEVAQSTVPSQIRFNIYHPTNVENNIGICFKNDNGTITVYIFDLTTDTIIKSGVVDYVPSISTEAFDCILVDDEIRLVSENQFRTSNTIYTLNINDLSMTEVTVSHACCGFVDDNKLYGYTVPEWFYQTTYIYGDNINGSTEWTIQGSSNPFPRISGNISGWGNNGFIWLPCQIDNIWSLGKFAWSGSTDFVTPVPITTIGEFPSDVNIANYPTYYAIAHNYGRTKTAFRTSLGLYLTDYSTLKLIDSTPYLPLAMRDRIIICTDRINTYIIKL